MTGDQRAQDLLENAVGTPALLAAAYETFEHILDVLRAGEEHAGSLLPAFVMAATAAADGRDEIATAPGLSAAGLAGPPGLWTDRPAATADRLARLSSLLHDRLAAAGEGTDQAACTAAAACAVRIHTLLAGPGR